MSKSPPPECLNKCSFCRAGSKTGAAIRNQLAAGPLAAHGLAGEWPCPFGRGEVGTLARKAKAIGQGLASRLGLVELLPPEIMAARMATCQACEHSQSSGGRVCGKLRDALAPGAATCGCIVANKVRVPGQSCPLGKWLALTARP